VQLQHVGAFGLSAGGLTVLTLAGFDWSVKRFALHCAGHTSDDVMFRGMHEDLKTNTIPDAAIQAKNKIAI
jgi:predicted dienelactone hydrolase